MTNATSFDAIRSVERSVRVRAPGRVNLIGEHTDWGEGFCLPIAVEAALTLEGEARDDGEVRLSSEAFGGEACIAPAADAQTFEPAWARPAVAVLQGLRDVGLPTAGFEAVLGGDLPAGAGLGSSGAFLAVVALGALCAVRGAGGVVPPFLEDRSTLATLCREAEQRGRGVRCGILDPFAALHAVEGNALLLDCRTLQARPVAIDSAKLQLVVADSGVRRELQHVEYNRRREQGEEALQRLREAGVEAATLRDVSRADFEARAGALPAVPARRARHIVSENARTQAAARALEAGDFERFGSLLNQSHESLRLDYEVSCPELDALVDVARKTAGVYGSRMTGAGFGGCTVSAVRPAAAQTLLAAFEQAGHDASLVVPSGPAG